VHHDHPSASHPRWSRLMAAVLFGYAIGAFSTRQRCRTRLTAARTEATHDPLTGLPNRRAAVAEVNARLSGGPFVLALLDLDDFKSVNDALGHSVGDDLLRVVAARLYVAIPPEGFAARLGGDEFLILLPDDGGDHVDTVTTVLALLAEPVHIGAATLRPHASAGVVTTASGAVSFRQLIEHADLALYCARACGHAVAAYDPQRDPPSTPGSPRPRIRRRDRRPRTTGSVPDMDTPPGS
jgi:diguanylate cyclase (GGDEF)-like protein